MVLNARKVWASDNRAELILLAIDDITERWRAGVAFGDSRERYRVIVEGATSYAIFTIDMHGTVTTWNAGAERMLGYSEGEIVDRDFCIIFTPEDIEAGVPKTEMRAAEAEGQALDERWHLRKSGELFWANGLLMPLKDDTDQTRGFLKVVRDMTEQKNLEEALRRRTADLERADVQKNQFLAMLAHELRNPVAAIRNAVAISALSRSVEQLDWCREVINRQVHNFAHLIDDLLDVSRVTEGKIQLRRELTDAIAIVRNAMETVKPLMEERNHELRLSFKSTDLKLGADPVRLEQILVNLLTNAAKYTPDGGRIHLIVGVEGEEVIFRVRDNGVGIPPELLPRMFDLFAQGDRSLARSEGGLGIGLTLVKALAELHGGTVTAASGGQNEGSEFIVRLPAAFDTAAAGPTLGAAGPAARQSRVLVVDDNADMANGLGRILTLSGHVVRVAYNGLEAVVAAREDRPEVVLLDIGLPGMDGYEVAARLRQEECCKDAIIIAVSGYGEEEARQRSQAAGIDHHIIKPVNIDHLLSILERR
jgi:PAS domain S-box-containing protein